MTLPDEDRPDPTLQDLLEAGVPWPMALEALASTRLDRDQTHSLDLDGGQQLPG